MISPFNPTADVIDVIVTEFARVPLGQSFYLVGYRDVLFVKTSYEYAAPPGMTVARIAFEDGAEVAYDVYRKPTPWECREAQYRGERSLMTRSQFEWHWVHRRDMPFARWFGFGAWAHFRPRPSTTELITPLGERHIIPRLSWHMVVRLGWGLLIINRITVEAD